MLWFFICNYFTYWLFTFGKSLIQIENKRGPNTDLFGTPVSIFFHEEVWPFKATPCWRPLKQFFINFKKTTIYNVRSYFKHETFVPNFVKFFWNIKEGPSCIAWWITIITFVDFICNWQELSNTWINWNEARLTFSKSLFCIK